MSSTLKRNVFEVIPNECFLPTLQSHIQEAQESVDLQFYRLEADQYTAPVIKTIGNTALQRNLQIRMLQDHLPFDPRRLLLTQPILTEARLKKNVAVKCVSGVPFLLTFRRDHRKIVTVDGGRPAATAYIGGMNLSRDSSEWHDFMVRMQGPIVPVLQGVFNGTWEAGHDQAKKYPVTEDTYVLTDSREQSLINTCAYQKIQQARSRVWLKTPFLDLDGIGKQLVHTKQRDPSLDVRVIVPGVNAHTVYSFVSGRRLNELPANDVRTYKYGPDGNAGSHGKLLIVDNEAIFGSSNFSADPFAGQNAEVGIVTRNHDLVEKLAGWYEDTIDHSQELGTTRKPVSLVKNQAAYNKNP